MSTAMTFKSRTQVKPPEKGSFPLDHDAECKLFTFAYMKCLRKNGQENTKCREEAKDYLGCRMERNLMAQQEWTKLGFEEGSDKETSDKETSKPA